MTTRFRFGDVTVERIVEGEYPFAPLTMFFPTLAPDILAENRSWLQNAGVIDDKDHLVLCLQSYVVRTPRHTILVDTCVGNHKSRATRPLWDMKTDGAYMGALAAAGLSVEDIDIVLCTHLHVDHVGWNTRLEDGRWVPTFPNARYLFSARELAHWTEQNARTPLPYFTDSVLPIVEAQRHTLVQSDAAIDDDIRLMPTPGHTPDHFSVVIGRSRDEAVITGDLIHSPIQARYPELVMFADQNPTLAVETRRSFLERYCETDTTCCTAHFPSPSAVKVRRWGDGFRCEPAAG